MRHIFLVLLALLVLASTALAHPGGTDGNGGHYDRSTGEYHYHHGYSAHDHPNGVCPYKSKAKATATLPKVQATPRPTAVLNVFARQNSSTPTTVSTRKPATASSSSAQNDSSSNTITVILIAVSIALGISLLDSRQRIRAAEIETSTAYKKMRDQASHHACVVADLKAQLDSIPPADSLRSELEYARFMLESSGKRCQRLESKLGQASHDLAQALQTISDLENHIAYLEEQCDLQTYYASRDMSRQ